MLKPTIYLIPRWAGNAHSDWYDWIVIQIKAKYDIDIYCIELPDWHEPTPEKSLNYLSENIKKLNEQCYFIGHSVGCQAILQFLNKQNPNTRIGGFLFVAGWFEVDKPWESLKPWLKTDILDFSFISKLTNFKQVILSDNDPFTSDFQRSKSLWKTCMNANVKILSGGKHFNNSIETEVLFEVEKMILYALNQ
jgi:predicted alpha/beta hydrolase family esterase